MNVDNLNIVIKASVNTAKQALSGLENSISKVTSVTHTLSSAWSKFSSVVKNGFNKVAGTLKNFFNQLVGVKLNFADMLTLSMDYIENLNLWKVSMGECVGEATKFQNIMAEAFGTNLSDAVRYQAVFQQMSDAIGMTNKQASILSENMTKLGYDISSFYNLDIEDAMSKLQAGLAGQTKPLRSLGMDITQQSLTPILQSLGINDRSVSQLTQAEKMILRYIAIMRQSTNAQTDMARTIEQPANQLRILKAQVIECGRWIGNVFIGTFGKIIPYINGFVMAIKEVIKLLANLVGFQSVVEDVGEYGGGISVDTGDDGESLANNMGKAAKSAKKINDNLQSIDEVHNLTEDSSSSGGSGSVGGAFGDIDSRLLEGLKGYDNLMGGLKTKANDIRDSIMEWLGFTKQVNEETQEIYWTYTGEGWSEVGEKLTEAFKKATDFLIDRINNVPWDKVGQTISDVLTGIDFGVIFGQMEKLLMAKIKAAFTVITNIDWVTLFKNLTDGLSNALINFFMDFKDIDFGYLGAMLGDALSNIDWLKLVTSIVLGLGIVAEKILEFVGGLLSMVLVNLGKWWDGVVADFNKWLHDFFNGIFSAIAKLFDDINNAIIDFFVGIFDGAVKLLEDIGKSILDFFKGIIDFIGGVITTIGNIIMGVVGWFANAFNNAKNKVVNIVTAIVNWLTTFPTKIYDKIKGVVTKFKQVFDDAKKKVGETLGKIPDEIKKLPDKILKVFDKLDDWKDMGKKLIDGLWKGVTDGWEKLKGGAKKFTKNVTNGIKDFFGIKSPSRVFRDEIGKYLSEGIVVGFTADMDKRSQDMINSLNDNVNAQAFGRIASVGDLNNTTSALQGVANAIGSLTGEDGTSEIVGTIDGQTFIKLVVNGINGMTTKNGKFPLKIT